MISRYLLLLLLLTVGFRVAAQNISLSQQSVTFGAGISMAPEELAGIKSMDGKGYVEHGPVVMLSYLAMLHKYVGIGATLAHSRNNLNADAVADSFISATTVQTETYTLTYLMGDVYGTLPVNKWLFYARGSLGSILPDLWTMEISNDVGKGTVQSGQKFVPAYAGALGLNYKLGKVSIGLESCLLASRPEFDLEMNQVITYRKQWLSAFNHTIRTGFSF
ncbi:hypothetical protein [Pontibacter burrus]|uniref:Outer membrane protein beta-barrel domain-containing protein n=1 Tax=Pontibacter burrus TaxID=2704466 RepID=A0A6B3LSQ2_9BACT|nr:hypothetical protein [Pontibacter burrus]NEM96597.1 hypothetical protein [Pontibacter burrus]